MGWHGGVTGSVATSQFHGPWFASELRLMSVFSYAGSPPSFSLSVHCFPPISQKLACRWTGYMLKLPLGVNVWVFPCNGLACQSGCIPVKLHIFHDPEKDKALTEEELI